MFGDKLSIAHGLEGRVPYLDRTVVEFAERLNTSMKIRGRSGKWLHRRVCEKYLPPAILNRKKRGFALMSSTAGSVVDAERTLNMLLDESSLICLLSCRPADAGRPPGRLQR
jgi:asparagine synthetase B (glutamine-hydrolysing)